jgi:hypothetical protein
MQLAAAPGLALAILAAATRQQHGLKPVSFYRELRNVSHGWVFYSRNTQEVGMSVQPFLTIATFPGQVVELACSRCARKSVHAKARLARLYGDELGIPELIQRLSQDCPHRKSDGAAGCGAAVRFPGAPIVIAVQAPAVQPRR